jgi:radical SAM superfamily enzyme YgiQ (UPF0313 family)
MKCALVIPSWIPEDLFPTKTAGSQINYWQPLGTLYVASALIEHGHEVRFFNGAFLSHPEIMQQLHEFAPEFVGLYSTTFGWPRAVTTAKAIKALDDKVFICVGGPYPTAVAEECLSDGDNSIDAVIYGEAEVTAPALVNALQHHQSLDNIQGIVFRDGDEIVKNPARALIEDLDKMPFPARHLLGEAEENYLPPPATYKRKPVAVIITSRGCDRRCIYCSQFDQKRKSGVRGIRYRSIENVLNEIEYCLKRGYKEIKFIDDTLASDYDRAMQLCQAIKERGLNFSWFASACANQVDKPLLQAMKDAGCWAVLFGAESGVQKNLNTLRKGIKLEHVRAAVKAAKDVGLKVSTPFIIGIPGETYEDALKTIDFAIELNPDFANFHALTPFPGTHLHNNIEKYGSVAHNLEEYTYQGAAFVPFTMSRRQIQELRQLAFRKFYGRPSFLFRKVLQLRTVSDCKAAYYGVRSLFWLYIKKGVFNRKRRHNEMPVRHF